MSSRVRDVPAEAEPPIVVEHREQLIYLLREAAELEHTILCEYLFAAFTMKQRTDEGLTAAQLDAVDRWRKTILTVAKQEMLHLTLVQNLLTAIGAAPHLSRPNLPTAAKHFPAGVQIALVPFGERALKHFLFLERPEGVALDDPDAQVAIDRARPLMADDDIVPAPQSFATVGHLYRAIDVGFAWLTGTLGEERLFIGPAPAQTSPDVMHWDGLIAVTDLDSAHQAIDVVVEQGEGATGDWREAHFGKFLEIYDEYLALRAADPTFEPARPVLPGHVRPHRYGDAVPLIDDPRTRRVADLFNVVNEIVLLALTRFFAHTDESPEQLALLENVGVGLMFAAIKPLGQLLTTLPFGPSAPGQTAGPTFELFYIGGYLLPHRKAAWTLIAERLRQAAGLARRIEAEGLALKGLIAGLEKYAGQLETA
ncbi:MAG TPA: ferritin-like protein [Candidatus Limnocylindria bacterium]|nr:ferritin-like protein [Candidatus Limnocylindria bacterium]